MTYGKITRHLLQKMCSMTTTKRNDVVFEQIVTPSNKTPKETFEAILKEIFKSR